MGFVAHFVHFSAVQKLFKSVKIWQSYKEFKGGNLLAVWYESMPIAHVFHIEC